MLIISQAEIGGLLTLLGTDDTKRSEIALSLYKDKKDQTAFCLKYQTQ